MRLILAVLTLLLNTVCATGQDETQIQWARQLAAPTGMFSTAATVDASGNSYFTAYGAQQYLFDYNTDDPTLLSAASTDNLLIKYDSTGVLQWVKKVQNGLIEQVFFQEKEQQLFVTGSFADSIVFAPGMKLSAPHGFYLAKYTADGTLLKAQLLASDLPVYTLGLHTKIDGKGNILLTGLLHGTAYLGGTQLGDTVVTADNGSISLLCKLDSLGKYQWVRSWSIGQEMWPGITGTDSLGNIYVAGYFSGNGFLGNTYFWGFDTSDDLFLMKYSPAGTLLWSKHIATIGEDYLNNLIVELDGTVFLNGFFSDATVTFNRGRPDESTTSVANPYPSNQISFLFKMNQAGEVTARLPVAATGIQLIPCPNGLSATISCSSCMILPDSTAPVSLLGDWPRESFFLLQLDKDLNYLEHSDWLFSSFGNYYAPEYINALPNGDYFIPLEFQSSIWLPGVDFSALGDNRELLLLKTTSNPALPASEPDNSTGFRLWPNPVGDWVTLEMGATDEWESATVTNALGQIVFRSTVFSETIKIDSKNWQPGVYNVTIISSKGNFSKICIKH